MLAFKINTADLIFPLSINVKFLSMNVLWTLLFLKCCLLLCGVALGLNATEPGRNNTFEIELFPPNPTYAGQTRMPRTFLKKIHSGAAFLAGLKLGALLSKKGFELGHGKIASTHSFQIFGKSVNSAMSLSYGNLGSLLPVVDDTPESEESEEDKKSALKKNSKVFHVAVIEDVPPEVAEKEQGSEVKGDDIVVETKEDKKNEKIAMLYQDTIEQPEVEKEANFLEEHNQRVKDFNKILLRKNSKF